MYCDRSNFGVGPKSDLSTRAQMDWQQALEGWQRALPGYRKHEGQAGNPREEGAEVRNQERGNKEQHLSQRQNQPGEEGAKGRGEREVKEERGGESTRVRVWPRGLASPQRGLGITANSPERCVQSHRAKPSSGTEGPERARSLPKVPLLGRDRAGTHLSRPLSLLSKSPRSYEQQQGQGLRCG